MPRKSFYLFTFVLLSLFTVCCQTPGNSNAGSADSTSDKTEGINQSEPRDLSPVDFRNLVDKTPEHVLLDVRTETERLQNGFMLDSEHLDFYRQDFNTKLDELDKSKTYFVYCRSGKRSGSTVDRLRSKGYKAYNLKGGFMEWTKTFPF